MISSVTVGLEHARAANSSVTMSLNKTRSYGPVKAVTEAGPETSPIVTEAVMTNSLRMNVSMTVAVGAVTM